jgi:hypothetical protein
MSKRRPTTPRKGVKDSTADQNMNGSAESEIIHPAAATTVSPSTDPKLVAYVNDTRHFSFLRYFLRGN